MARMHADALQEQLRLRRQAEEAEGAEEASQAEQAEEAAEMEGLEAADAEAAPAEPLPSQVSATQRRPAPAGQFCRCAACSSRCPH